MHAQSGGRSQDDLGKVPGASPHQEREGEVSKFRHDCEMSLHPPFRSNWRETVQQQRRKKTPKTNESRKRTTVGRR